MRKVIMTGIGAGGILIVLAAAAVAGGKPATTIQECAALVPPGKHYSFDITGTIDTTGASARVSGTFTVSDPSLPKELEEMPAEAKSFVECVGSLIK